MYKLRPYQVEAVGAALQWVKKTTDPCLLELPTGCHEKGYKILMESGETKSVEDVEIGDRLASPGGGHKTVLKLHRGYDDMYRIIPVSGEAFVVNSGHILNLYKTKESKNDKNCYVNISVSEYLSKTKWFKHIHKLHKSTYKFNSRPITIDPWVLGFLIGDGCLSSITPSVTVCHQDLEVVDLIEKEANKYDAGLTMVADKTNRGSNHYSIHGNNISRSKRNKFTVELEKLNINVNSEYKFVPDNYKFNSASIQNDVLSGLLDSDGHYDGKCFDYISKSKRLADDVVFISRCLGLHANVSECIKSCQNNFSGTYYRVCISGNLDMLNIRTSRRIPSKRKMNKSPLVTGFSVEYVGRGDYYGFELDGDHLYLGHDFFVHHNSGKSLILAEISKKLTEISKGKKVLVLQPSKELLEQNSAKYKLTGEPCSLFSASVGAKSTRHSVVFGTPLTIKGSLRRFGADFCAVILDEAHLLTPTISNIINNIRNHNSRLRVIGLTATPFSMNNGLMYKIDQNDKPVPEDLGRDQYFTKLVYKIGARSLIDQGYLTQPVIGSTGDSYDTSNLEIKSGKYTTDSIDRAFVGKGRKTSAIVEEIVFKSRGHRTVMIFGATVNHCKEIMESLPPEISAMVDGGTNKKMRESIIKRAKDGQIKYLVSCETLTTGVDIESVSIIALLRPTLSPVLITQIIGRALRLYPDKREAIILDYTASTIDHFFPDGDLFSPRIKVASAKKESNPLKAICPDCQVENEFSAKENEEGYAIDINGYFVDLDGNRIPTDFGPMSAHWGRRCFGMVNNKGTYERCEYRWTFKPCPECEAENDIAARRCISCKAEIIDPNEKLAIEYRRMRRDPTIKQTDKVLSWDVRKTMSRAGNECLAVDYTTEHRTFTVWYTPKAQNHVAIRDYEKFMKATKGGDEMPETITFQKSENGFYRIYGYNEQLAYNERPNN